MRARLITIPFSHYCEKARWALERCELEFTEDGHLPLFHYVATRRAHAKRTVPAVVVGPSDVLTDSSDIITWADAHRPGTLLPADAAARAAALALEDDFDRNLGPAARRWAYAQLLPRRDLDAAITRDVPRWEAIAFRLVRPIAVGALRRRLKITPDGVARSRTKIDEVFARVGALLADGRRYLAGGSFSVADLTLAALAAPFLMPPEHPYARVNFDTFVGPGRAQMEAWRATPAGQLALRLYREDRC